MSGTNTLLSPFVSYKENAISRIRFQVDEVKTKQRADNISSDIHLNIVYATFSSRLCIYYYLPWYYG